jgi:hypothetical protein
MKQSLRWANGCRDHTTFQRTRRTNETPGTAPARRRRPPRRLHHFVSDPAKEEGIGLVEVLDRLTMQVLVRGNCTMIAAPVQSDVDGVPKGSHLERIPPMGKTSKQKPRLATLPALFQRSVVPALPIGLEPWPPNDWGPQRRRQLSAAGLVRP